MPSKIGEIFQDNRRLYNRYGTKIHFQIYRKNLVTGAGTSEQTVHIRLLPKEQSHQSLYCISFLLYLYDAVRHCKNKLLTFLLHLML